MLGYHLTLRSLLWQGWIDSFSLARDDQVSFSAMKTFTAILLSWWFIWPEKETPVHLTLLSYVSETSFIVPILIKVFQQLSQLHYVLCCLVCNIRVQWVCSGGGIIGTVPQGLITVVSSGACDNIYQQPLTHQTTNRARDHPGSAIRSKRKWGKATA